MANYALASWTAAALCRYSTAGLRRESGRGLPQSKTLRNFPAGFQNPATVLIKPLYFKNSTFALNSGVRNLSGLRICTLICNVPLARFASGAISAT